MDNSLWDSLTIKVSQFVKEHIVLQGHRALGSNGHGGGLAVNWVPMAGCKDIRDLYDAEQHTISESREQINRPQRTMYDQHYADRFTSYVYMDNTYLCTSAANKIKTAPAAATVAIKSPSCFLRNVGADLRT